ncbi:MAG: fibronectin type III domain-containing protein [Flavobacteriales bacterium]|jgi:hypothetical protein|nr:fibronectin type III domain-containing protein [Flavobacteriales bacterium]MBK9534107.1 fibronectin type III domain-containing protein [Flavobacteriales bacterium]HQV53690.1 fibronectin type III domain-containing protein [Flavobacteriales bacterium]HQX31557.1 fibronectin type III domain-containing protein [Flavobacteriales bacterium]HQX37904.1 fibronectin type III domain-containing protein [Flavobacteriales bacterium]
MAKYTVKTGTNAKDAAAVLEKGRTVAAMLLGNPGYPMLQTQLPALNVLCDALETTSNAMLFNGGKLSREAKHLAFEALRDALKEISGFVQGISKGDKALILSAGFDVVKPRTKLQTPESPKDLKVQRTVERGILKVKWTRVSCSKLSYLEMAEKGSDAWQRIHTTRNSHVMTNLQTGTEYCFRVQAVTTGGISPMSEVVSNIAA